MNLSGIGFRTWILVFLLGAGITIPGISMGEEFKTFVSDEYGFTMKYPATWVKVEQGNYYVVFQSPDLIDGYRSRINVAAHKPIKDPMNVFLDELRTGISDLQKRGGNKQGAKILDEGEFKCEVPGAYFFFLQAFDKVWQDVVIVFFKHDQTLLRISCLAPSQSMEKLQPIYNEVLTSVKFVEPGSAQQPPRPSAAEPPVYQQPAQPRPQAPGAQVKPPHPAAPAPAPEAESESEEEVTPEQPPAQQPVAPAPKPAPRGPSRGPEKPGTGIVN